MNPLTDLIPALYRKYVYAVLSVAVFVYGIWQASQGDWGTFVGSLVAALSSAMASANVKPTPAE